MKDILAVASAACVASCETCTVGSVRTSEITKGAQRIEAVFRVDQAIKGLTNSQIIQVELAHVEERVPEQADLSHLIGTRWLLFLTSDPGVTGIFHVVDDRNAMIMVGPRVPGEPCTGSARECLEFEIAGVLKTNNEALVPRMLRLLHGWWDFGKELQEAIQTATESQKAEIQGGSLALRISLGDINALSLAENFRGTEGAENELRASIANITDCRAIPSLAKIASMSGSARIKAGAIQALRNMASPKRREALRPAFASALDVDDRAVQYDAIVGLGKIMGRIPDGDFSVSVPVGSKPLPAPVPSFDEFLKDPTRHIAVWREIAGKWQLERSTTDTK